MLVLSGVFFGIGLVGLTLIIVFKRKVNEFYDSYKTLTETQKKYYKNVMVFIPFIVFIIFGIYSLSSEITGFTLKDFLMKKNLNVSQFLGISAIVYGLFTLIIRFTKIKYLLFSKLRTFEDKYGYTKGNRIHIVSYTLSPIILGLLLLLVNRKII